jgi:hypothetical protein
MQPNAHQHRPVDGLRLAVPCLAVHWVSGRNCPSQELSTCQRTNRTPSDFGTGKNDAEYTATIAKDFNDAFECIEKVWESSIKSTAPV